MTDKQTSAAKDDYHHGNLRVELLRVARDMLEAEGINALKLRAITRQAGVSAMAATPHFGNLRGLLTALATQGFEELACSLREGNGRSVKDAGLAYVLFAVRNPGLFTLMFRGDAINRQDAAFTHAAQQSFGVLGQLLAQTEPPKTHKSDVGGEVGQAALWAKVHGLAVLAIDGLLAPLVAQSGFADHQEAFLAQALDAMVDPV